MSLSRSARFACLALVAALDPLALSAAPAIRGQVLAPTGMPLAGARAELAGVRGDTGPVATAVTATHGRYLLNSPGAGVYRVRIVAPDRATLLSPPLPLVEDADLPPAAPPPSGVAISPRAADGFWMVAPSGEPAPPQRDPLRRAQALVSGLVVATGTGRPIAGVLVWSRSDPSAFQLSDADGRFRVQVAATRPARLEARAAGRLPKPFTPSPLQVETGRLPALALEREATVGGRVVDLAGRAVADAWVSASVPGRRGIASGASSRLDGTFKLSTLRPSELYELRAAKPGFLPAKGKAVPPVPSARSAAVSLVLHAARPAQGRVQDHEGIAVAGAEIRLTEAPDPAARQRPGLRPERNTEGPTAVSERDGRFRVAEVPAFAFDVVVTRLGFARAELRNFKVPPGAGPIDLGTIRLLRGAALEGRVVDAEGRPIGGAAVFHVLHLHPPHALAEQLKDMEPDATSGADGAFTLADLAWGSPVHLLVTARGFLAATARGVRPPTASPLVVRLDAGASLVGRLVDEQERPVRGAEVDVTWQPRVPGREDLVAGLAVAKRALSDRTGRFMVPDLPLGAVEIAVEARGFIAVSQLPAVVPQAADEELTIRLERGTTLEGRVVTSAGDPVAGARILVGSAVGLSDEEGLFRVTGIVPGPQLVEARHPHYEPLARRMTIEPAGSRAELVFAAGQEVRGLVVDPSGQPVAGAAVDLAAIAQRLPRRYRVRADAEGAFLISPVSRGTYRLRASAEGYGEGELEPLQVGGEPVEDLTVVLRPAGTIRGRVRGLTPHELAQVEVRATRGTAAFRVAEVDAAGNYLLRDLEAGDWLVTGSLGDGRRKTQARVPLRPGDEAARDLDFGGGLKLSGLVLYRQQPLPETWVSLHGQQKAVDRSTTTDYQGRFTFEELEADTYQVGLANQRERVTHNELVTVTEDREVLIELERTNVAGVVVDALTRKPVPAAVVVLRHAGGSDTPEFMLAGGSDADGLFNLPPVPPARYSMIVTKEGYSPAQRELEVALESETAGIEVRLQPSPGLDLDVRLASGGRPTLLYLRLFSLEGQVVLAGSQPVGQDGAVRLATAPPGHWMLLIAAAGGALTAVPVQVPGHPVPLTLADAKRLVVRVEALATSDTVATVRLAGSDGRAVETLGPGGTVLSSWPMVGGSAVIEGVPAGSWSVHVQAPNGSTWTGPVTIDGVTDAVVALD